MFSGCAFVAQIFQHIHSRLRVRRNGFDVLPHCSRGVRVAQKIRNRNITLGANLASIQRREKFRSERLHILFTPIAVANIGQSFAALLPRVPIPQKPRIAFPENVPALPCDIFRFIAE
jgi:hypothetical protein